MSSILDDDWEHDGHTLRLSLATEEVLQSMEAWPELRVGASNVGWDWRRLSQDHRDCFVASIGSEPVFALAGLRAGVTTVAGVPCYRLDFLEVGPRWRGRGLWGAFALVVAAHRATELGAEGLVMAARPDRLSWLERLGAKPVPKHAWRCARELVAVWIIGAAFRILRGS